MSMVVMRFVSVISGATGAGAAMPPPRPRHLQVQHYYTKFEKVKDKKASSRFSCKSEP